jgi:hypothetical protein
VRVLYALTPRGLVLGSSVSGLGRQRILMGLLGRGDWSNNRTKLYGGVIRNVTPSMEKMVIAST